MAEIGFYHLTRTGPDQALPALLDRTLAAGERAVVLCGSPERVATLDKALWECKDPDWLPHGTARTGHAELQPIWLTTEEERPNGARFLFLLDGRAIADWDSWTRVFDLFDGSDDGAVAAARQRWTAAKAAGHVLTYWRQGERGWTKG
ncbi:MAG: DNA polymerase III subunit chi [Acetobacteraceae bacterium]|nr:DNA polymerase III subunit chi [Acetobacteraceae bacterium]